MEKKALGKGLSALIPPREIVFVETEKHEKIINVLDNSISQLIITTRENHSKKPAEVREKIIRVFGDLPRIELFSRDKIEGWDCWGNEVPTDEQRLLIK